MKKLLIIFICLFLAGCVTKVEYVYLTEKQAVDIPEEFFSKPAIPTPPLKEKYLSLTCDQKEKTLSELILKLYKTTNDFSNSFDLIKEYNLEQKKIIESQNTEKKK